MWFFSLSNAIFYISAISVDEYNLFYIEFDFVLSLLVNVCHEMNKVCEILLFCVFCEENRYM